MKETIVVDLVRLHSDTKNLKYKKKFGTNKSILNNKSNVSGSIKFEKVSDEPEPFINLFGLSVGTETGNIALGLFPNPNCYILIGNVFKIFASRVFHSNSLPEYVDKKLLLELIKVNPLLFIQNFANEFKNMYLDFLSSDVQKSNSIILELVRNREASKEKSVNATQSIGVSIEGLINFAYECVNKFEEWQKLAVEYFGAFISESDTKEMSETLSKYKNTDELLESSVPNLNARFIKFLKYGIDVDFLIALSSFGFGIKQRKWLLNILKNITFSDRGIDYIFYASILGSFSYMDYNICEKGEDVVKKQYDKIICYNIIDMLHAVRWDNAFMFSLGLIKDFKNFTAYERLKEKYSLQDFWLESRIEEKLFVQVLNYYNLNILPKIDAGSMYTREVKFSQYSLPVFSIKQMMNSGRVFSEISDILLKRF